MSQKVAADLKQFNTTAPVRLLPHPLYDHFGAAVPQPEARVKTDTGKDDKVILFFGFIRKYKGLDLLLHAMADERIKSQNIKLLVAGEWYEDEAPYRALITKLGIEKNVRLYNNFIPDEEVKYYLCAADCVVQPYRSATQSGVTPLAYHFEKPMIVTAVGGLPDMVPHEKAGLVCLPEPLAIADAVVRFFELGAAHFLPFIREEKKKYAWGNMVSAILELGTDYNPH